MARPTKLSQTITDAVCEALDAGLSIEGACARAGIAPSTYHDWVNRGSEGEEPFAEFSEATARARASVEERLLESVEWAAGERIQRKALGRGEGAEIVDEVERDWRAAAWLLERKFPAAYGNRQRLEHTGAGGGAIEFDLPEGAGDAAAEFIAKIAGSGPRASS